MSSLSASKLKNSRHQSDLKIFVKDVRDRQGKKRPLTVRTWSTIKDVKDMLQQLLLVPPSAQRLYYGPLLVSGKELPNHRTLADAGIYRSGETLLLDIHGGGSTETDPALFSSSSSLTSLQPRSHDICISSSMLESTPKSMRRVVQRARRGLALGFKPDLVLDGTGGTYFLHDARKCRVAVFKPSDEEPYAENNPRGYIQQGLGVEDSTEGGMRAGIRVGEACLREVAAFLLDHGGFSGVPMTTLAEARHPAFNTNGARWNLAEGGAAVGAHSLSCSMGFSSQLQSKVGSCQDFVNAEYTMDDLSPSKLNVDEVHKIAILDIRLMNADRNSANLLVRRKKSSSSSEGYDTASVTNGPLELVPIDHGYCLRSVGDISWFDWCWLDWPQLKQPLSKKSKEYVLNLDIEADARLLKEQFHITDGALDYFRASSTLLQQGVKMGMTLHDIALICCRPDNEGLVPSKLETIKSQAADLSTYAVENGKWGHESASRALTDQLTSQNLSRPLGTVSNSNSRNAVVKSASSVNLASGFGQFDDLDEDKRIVPNSMATSGSDSSSCVADTTLDQEECEEWAAAVLADVSIADDNYHDKGRSNSLGSSSDSSSSSKLSSSPIGFWHVRPGTMSTTNAGEEHSSIVNNKEDAVEWSPVITPLQSPTNSPRPSFSLPARPSMMRMSSSISSSLSDDFCGFHRSSSVSFNLPQAQVEIDVSSPEVSFPPPLSKTKLARSQSYSVFSSRNGSSSELKRTSMVARNMSDDETDQQYTYFLKFIDLLIERELRKVAK